MPGPVSAISTWSRSSTREVRNVSVPLPSIACSALSIKFVHTWFSSAPYAGMAAGLHERGRELVPGADAVVVEPVDELVLEVGRLERAQLGRLGYVLDRPLLQFDQRPERVPVPGAVGDQRELAAHAGHTLAQGRR